MAAELVVSNWALKNQENLHLTIELQASQVQVLLLYWRIQTCISHPQRLLQHSELFWE